MDDRGALLQAMRTLAELAQKNYGLSEDEIRHAIFSSTIPATIFRADATPLESIISYLSSTGADARSIGKAVGRSASYVDVVRARGTKHATPSPSPYAIPVGVLREGAAGETIAQHLASLGLTQQQIATLLCKDASTVWTWLRRAQTKQTRGART